MVRSIGLLSEALELLELIRTLVGLYSLSIRLKSILLTNIKALIIYALLI